MCTRVESAPIRPANDAVASEQSRSDNEASASTATQSVRTSGVRFAQAGRKEKEFRHAHMPDNG